jgi:hypothetical protein
LSYLEWRNIVIKLAGNKNSPVSSKSTPKKKKGRSELLEKSPVTPDVIHDKEREKCAKKPENKPGR